MPDAPTEPNCARDAVPPRWIVLAQELGASRPWEQLSPDTAIPFLADDEQPPLLASCFGTLGGSRGIALWRGPRPWAAFRAFLADDASERAALDVIVLTFVAFGDLPYRLATPLLTAGREPLPRDIVPCVLVRRPGCVPRAPDAAELALLEQGLEALHAWLTARAGR